jgi:hypothetical protein
MRIEPREQRPIQGPNGGTAMFRLARRLLQGPALQAFDAANITVPGNQVTFQRFEMVLNEMAKSYFTEDAASKQLESLRNTKKPRNIPIKQFASRVLEVNSFLPYFPPEGEQVIQPLNQAELYRTICNAAPSAWRNKLLTSNQRDLSLMQLVTYFSNLESIEEHQERKHKRRAQRSNHQNRQGSDTPQDEQNHTKQSSLKVTQEKWCELHQNHTHDTCDCRAIHKLREEWQNKRQTNSDHGSNRQHQNNKHKNNENREKAHHNINHVDDYEPSRKRHRSVESSLEPEESSNESNYSSDYSYD